MMLFLVGRFLFSSSLVSYSNANVNQNDSMRRLLTQTSHGYIDITSDQAWDLMNDADDGKQILIDVRRPEEYLNERIVTPNKEDWPRWLPYEIESDGKGPIKNQAIFLQFFIIYYGDEEIILYCRTGR